jgi:hypothetical protein
MTCFESGILNQPEGLLVATLVGLAFGFWLERAGFGSSRKLTSIFYFKDFAVLKVMFTAIVTAAVGLFLVESAGLIQVDSIFKPATFIWPQLIGGLLFGVGFVMGGWCPGTALVGASSGKGDALGFLAGAGVGSLVFGFAYPAIERFATAGAKGVSTLPELLGLGPGIVTALVTAMALGAFFGVGLLDRKRRQQAAQTATAGQEG